ncbi:MAG: hypothetical protein IKA61_05795 [Clostridia bacterium]|nr:hypothetical protein [Clostridia bacterium]
MKNKKRLGFLSAIMGICITATPIVGTLALADGEPTLYTAQNDVNVAFFENDVDYFKDGDKTVDLSSKDYPNLRLEVKLGGVELTEGSDYFYNNGTIIYGSVGDYTLTLYDNKGTPDKADDTVASQPATVTVKGKNDVNAPKYDLTDADKMTAFEEALEAKVSGLDEKTTSFELPSSFWQLLDLDVFESKHIVSKLYVAKPKSDFSVVNTSWRSSLSKVTVADNGTYAFYVEVKDCYGNELVVDRDTMIQKVDGWYKTVSDNGTPDDDTDDILERVIPIFSFDYAKEVRPLATVDAKVTSAIIGVEYTSGKVTSENVGRIKVTLYYTDKSVENVTVADLKNSTNGWVKATSEHATFGDLSATALKFTPNVKGSFAYMISATGSDIENTKIETCSKIITVTKSVQEQKLVNVKFRNFLKNNWLSLVFLAIAFLCIVGIIVLAFYKPKDAEEVAAKKRAKKEKIEDPEDEEKSVETEESEEVEEAEEAPAEEAEEAEEAPADEAEEAEEAHADEAEETPAEEPAPAEEAPVEAPAEDVKPEGDNA